MLGRFFILSLAFATLVAAHFPLSFPRAKDIEFQDQTGVSYRLPNNTRPISYDVHLTTHVHTQTDFSFTGEVLIRFVAIEPSNTITVHQRQLTIGASSLALASSPQTPIPLMDNVEYDTATELLKFTLKSGNLIINSEYILAINYNGTLRSDNFGFYRSSYIADDGSQR